MATSGIVDDHVMGWTDYSLPAQSANQEEVVDIVLDNSLIDDRTWQWVRQLAGVVIEESLVDSLVD